MSCWASTGCYRSSLPRIGALQPVQLYFTCLFLLGTFQKGSSSHFPPAEAWPHNTSLCLSPCLYLSDYFHCRLSTAQANHSCHSQCRASIGPYIRSIAFCREVFFLLLGAHLNDWTVQHNCFQAFGLMCSLGHH